MAWMSDEKYELMQDTREKAITARSAHNTRTHCGKGGAVKFPSDNLTKKEREAMNSECKSYRMNDPMTWEQFKAMPDDLKVIYIKALRNKYNVPDTYIANMFGVVNSAASKLFNDLGLGVGKSRSGRCKWDKDGFLTWCNGVKVEPKEEAAPESQDDLIAVTEDAEIKNYDDVNTTVVKELAVGLSVNNCRECKEYSDAPTICTNQYHYMSVIPSNGSMVFKNNRAEDALATMKSLLQDARVTMTITWEVAPNEPVNPEVYENNLKKQITTANYALLNAQRKAQMNTKG